MSRAQRHKSSSEPVKSESVEPAKIKLWLPIVLVVVLAGVPFYFGKYFEFNTPDPYDSGMNVYSAAHILAGAEIGVEETPSADIGTLLINILGVKLFGFSEVGPKSIQMLLQVAALVMMFIAVRKIFGSIAAVISVMIASLYLSSPLIAKFGNVKEQYMIACMVIGLSFFVMYQLNNRWLYAALTGAFVIWAPLFKATGTSVIGALGVFVIAQPLLKNRSFRQTGIDILLLAAGAAVSIAPLYIWIIGWDIKMGLPYGFVLNELGKFIPKQGAAEATQASGGYVASSRKLVPFAEQWPRVLRYYWLLILPVSLAVCSILVRLIKLVFLRAKKSSGEIAACDRLVLLLAVWWLLDMAFVWISPRSYEQYYLPLCASAAMLGGYVIALYSKKLHTATVKVKWLTGGGLVLLLMFIMFWHVIVGIQRSPHSGGKYGERRKGYVQTYRNISGRAKGSLYPWQRAGQYIQQRTDKDDTIYTWGWYPGIYVNAQRFSASVKACMMPRPAPAKLTTTIEDLVAEFKKEAPKYIVDSRKLHIPTNRPPYELWPTVPAGFGGLRESRFLPADNKWLAAYQPWWEQQLRKAFGDDEADRFIALKPLRDFVMSNYEIAEPQQYVAVRNPAFKLMHRMFGSHVVFRLKEGATAGSSE